jgi:hypothetical protein
VQTPTPWRNETWIFKQSKASWESNSSGNPANVSGLRFLVLVAAAGDLSDVNHAARVVNYQMTIAA